MRYLRQRSLKSIILLVSLTSLSFFIARIHPLPSSSATTTSTNRRLSRRQRKRAVENSRNERNKNNKNNNKIPRRVDVVIIGAGLAGLSAAAHLSSLDPPVSFAILEANDYIGGRVQTSYLNDGRKRQKTPVDLGASRIDGHKYDLFFPDITIPDVPDFNATFDVLRDVQEMCDGGDRVTSTATMDDNGKHVAYELWDMYDEKRGRLLTSNEKTRLLDDLWYDGYLAYEDEVRSNLTTFQNNNNSSSDDIDIGTIMTNYKQIHNLSSFEEQFIDVINNADNRGSSGKNPREGSGRYSNPYKFITKPFSEHYLPWVAYNDDGDDDAMTAVWDYGEVEYLQGNFGNMAAMFAGCREVSGDLSQRIHLNTTVTKVSYSKTRGGKIVYNTRRAADSGEGSDMIKRGKIRSQVVLVTASLGALRVTPKEGGIKFKPALPSQLRDVIDNAGFGIIEKWFGYWDDDTNLPWKNRTVRWSSLIPNPTKNKNSNKTNSNNFNLFYNAYDVHNQKNIMIAFIFGDDALAMTNPTNSDLTIHQNAMTALRNIYGLQSVPEPNDYKITRWSQNPTIRGGMTFTAVNRNPLTDYITLGELIDNSLLFAGDAVNPFSVGTTHAAWQSGWEAADFIDKILIRKRVVCSLISNEKKCRKKFCRWRREEKVCVQGR